MWHVSIIDIFWEVYAPGQNFPRTKSSPHFDKKITGHNVSKKQKYAKVVKLLTNSLASLFHLIKIV